MTTILVLAVVGAIISIVIGTVWYMPTTPTGRLHMRYLGFDKLSPEEQKALIEKAKPTMWKTYLGQMILSLITSFAVVFIVSTSVQNGVPLHLAILFPIVNWLCFSVPAIGGQILWGNCDPKIAWQKFFSDTGCILVTVVVVGAVTAYFS